MMLSQTAREALQYVVNTNGGATVEMFFEDHEPIGDRLWKEIRRDCRLVTTNEQDRLVLTDEGRAALAG